MSMLWIWLFLLGTSLAKPKLDEDCELNAADTMVAAGRSQIFTYYIIYIMLGSTTSAVSCTTSRRSSKSARPNGMTRSIPQMIDRSRFSCL